MLLLFFAIGCRSLPTICDQDSPNHRVLDTFWGTLDQNYAVFEARLEGNWDDIGRMACASVSPDSNDDALFEALVGMAQALDDGHIQLEGGDREADGWRQPWPHLDAQAAIRTSHQQRTMLQIDGLDAIAWGRLGDLGLLELTRLDEFSPSGTFRADRRAFRQVLDNVFADLGDTDGLILDLRFNEGGWDELGLLLASRFNDQRRLVWSTAQRNGPEHTDLSDFSETFLEADQRYDRPIVVLISGGTFSAGETLSMALRALPQVTLLGESTSGHLSDLYDGRLPNRWSFTYSGDLYRTADDERFEHIGIPPDVPWPFDAEALAAGHDVMLEGAIEALQ